MTLPRPSECKYGLTHDASQDENVSQPLLHVCDRNVKDVIMEIVHKRRYGMLLSEDEQRRLRNQEAGCNVPRLEVPLIIRKDLNMIAATVAYYQAALITEALDSDDRRRSMRRPDDDRGP